MCDLVPLVQLEKREKREKLQAEVCNFTKSNIPPWVFFLFLNSASGTKLHNAPHIVDSFFEVSYGYVSGQNDYIKNLEAPHFKHCYNLNKSQITGLKEFRV